MTYRNLLFLLFVPIYWVILGIFAKTAKEREYSLKMYFSVVVAIATAETVFYFVNPFDFLFVFSSIICTFGLLYFESGRVKKSFLLSVLWSVAGILAELVSLYVIVAFTHATADEIAHNDIAYCCGMFISRTILFALSVVYYQVFKQKKQRKTVSYWFATAFLFVGSISLMETFYYSSYNNLSDESAYQMLMVVLIILCINIIVFFLYERQEKYYEVEDTLLQMEHYIALQRQFYETEKEKIEKDRIERHDLRNYMLLLEHYVKEKEWDSLGNAILQKSREIETNEIIATGNEYLDVILTNKLRVAKEKGIEFYKDIQMKEILKLEQPLDLIAVIGNALDNAIEAACKCEKGKIELRIVYEKGLFRMLVKNSVAESVMIAADGTIPTTKKEQGHGYGIQSMKLIADKYAGGVEAQCIDGMFELSVLLFL